MNTGLQTGERLTQHFSTTGMKAWTNKKEGHIYSHYHEMLKEKVLVTQHGDDWLSPAWVRRTGRVSWHTVCRQTIAGNFPVWDHSKHWAARIVCPQTVLSGARRRHHELPFVIRRWISELCHDAARRTSAIDSRPRPERFCCGRDGETDEWTINIFSNMTVDR